MTSSADWPRHPCTLQDLLDHAAARFDAAGLYFGHGTDNAWDEALNLALFGLDLSWEVSADVLETVLNEREIATLTGLFERRIDERIPAAYITGTAWFAGLPFRVTPEVLIPRSPIAELIEQGFEPWLRDEPQRVLDLCTGSGCIGIVTALVFPKAEVDLSDISPAAIEVARDNIALHGLENRVRALTGDLFEVVGASRYDLIVCNPPYVDAEDFAGMPAEYRAEPALALASGDDGLDFTRRLLREARDHLTAEGCLVVEVGNSWEALEKAYPRVPFTWLEFAHGGHGVFVLSASELECCAAEFGEPGGAK